MIDQESEVAWIVCPLCDEAECVGRYNCKQIADYINSSKRKKMKMLREHGLTYQEIGDRVGVSKQYVGVVCGEHNPSYFAYIGKECIYPNLRDWMNDNKVSRRELLRRMGLTAHAENYGRLSRYLRGEASPRKHYIDRMLDVTGMTYEEMFYTEENQNNN